jgi:hypothetical protein
MCSFFQFNFISLAIQFPISFRNHSGFSLNFHNFFSQPNHFQFSRTTFLFRVPSITTGSAPCFVPALHFMADLAGVAGICFHIIFPLFLLLI